MKKFFAFLLTLMMIAAMLPVLSLTASAETETLEKIGVYGLDTYKASALDIVRDTTVENNTVSVTFRLKENLTPGDFAQIVLRFRYDTTKMTLTDCDIDGVFSNLEIFPSGTEEIVIPYTVIVECSNDNYLAGNICTLVFSVTDTNDTEVFDESKPYWWVDLGGVDTRGDGPNQPVTAFLPDYLQSFHKVTLYEGTRTGIPDGQPAPTVWVGGQGMTASTDGTVVSYYTNSTGGVQARSPMTNPTAEGTQNCIMTPRPGLIRLTSTT